MNELSQGPAHSSGFQVSISTLTLGTLYEAVLAFSSQDRFATMWPSVCQNARWLIPSRRMAILLCGEDESFEIAGTFERGKFDIPDDSQFTPQRDHFKRALTGRRAHWIRGPSQVLEDETDSFTAWLLHDHPDMLFVLPMRMKERAIGALLFAMTSVAGSDQAMLNTLGTIYALHAGTTCTLLRITEERRQMQNQLIMQERMASLGSLVAGITHEINNPAGAIQSAADVVSRCVSRIESLLGGGQGPQDFPKDERGQRVLTALKDNTVVIAAAGERITTIVRSLKNFARPDEAEYQRVSIHEGINTTLTLLKSELKDRITVVKEYGEIPKIHCSPGQLNQVFMSLLRNASEAIDGTGTIRIKTQRKGEHVRIQLSDSGRGIPPEKLKRIFNFNFSKTASRVKMGSGLATAYNIVQRHNGEIKAESKPGEGSSFTIILPLPGLK